MMTQYKTTLLATGALFISSIFFVRSTGISAFYHIAFTCIRFSSYIIYTSLQPDFRSAKFGECKLKDPEWKDKKTVSSEFCVYKE